MTTSPNKGVQVGSLTHYVLPDGPRQGEHRPAIVVRVVGDGLNLHIFNDNADASRFMGWDTNVHYSDEHAPRTWHWPEREESPAAVPDQEDTDGQGTRMQSPSEGQVPSEGQRQSKRERGKAHS